MVASRESQYKIFHFHHGGLDKLSEVFQQWKFCTETHLRDQVTQRRMGWTWLVRARGGNASLRIPVPKPVGLGPSRDTFLTGLALGIPSGRWRLAVWFAATASNVLGVEVCAQAFLKVILSPGRLMF